MGVSELLLRNKIDCIKEALDTHPTALNKTEYAKYHKKLTQLLGKQHRNYYESLIQESKNNLTKTWNIKSNNKITKCSKLASNYITKFDDKEMANQFTNYFAKIGPNLANVFLIKLLLIKDFLKTHVIIAFFSNL